MDTLEFEEPVAALLAHGAFKAKITTGSPARSAFELAAIGVLSAIVGYGVGALFAPR